MHELSESEPNNLFSEADAILALPVLISGQHDAADGTGDVFLLKLKASQVVHVNLETENAAGVQLLAYGGEKPEEIIRDFTEPFELHFVAVAEGTYFIYVYTPATITNQAAYELRIYAR
jgi:hypothetical protein